MEINTICKMIESHFLMTGKRLFCVKIEYKCGREGIRAITKEVLYDEQERPKITYCVNTVIVDEGVLEMTNIGDVEFVLEGKVKTFEIISDIEAVRYLEGDIEGDKYKRRAILMSEIRNSSLEYFSEDELIDILVAMKEESYLPNVEFSEDNKDAWKEFVNILAKPY